MMTDITPLSARINQLKGNMSYAELAEAIRRKTGKRISTSGLQHLGAGERVARGSTMAILAEYADRPIAWFYEHGTTPMLQDSCLAPLLRPYAAGLWRADGDCQGYSRASRHRHDGRYLRAAGLGGTEDGSGTHGGDTEAAESPPIKRASFFAEDYSVTLFSNRN